MAPREYVQVRVAEVVQETGDACSLVLDAAFDYQPGQFVTVRIPSQLCGSVARCYSLCSSPLAGERPAITVKRTAGGYASNWIFDHVVAGTMLDVLPPAGPARWSRGAAACGPASLLPFRTGGSRCRRPDGPA